MERVKILLYKDTFGFKKLSVTEGQVRLLSMLHNSHKIDGIEFFDMREVSPIDELKENFISIGNVDFSFFRILNYFKEGLQEVEIQIENKVIKEYSSIDRLKFLEKDSKERNYKYIIIQ